MIGFQDGEADETTDEPAALARDFASPHCRPEAASALSKAIARLFGELAGARQIIRHRDAELAAGCRSLRGPSSRSSSPSCWKACCKPAPTRANARQPRLHARRSDERLSSCDRASVAGRAIAATAAAIEGSDRRSRSAAGPRGGVGTGVGLRTVAVPEEFAAALCVPVSAPRFHWARSGSSPIARADPLTGKRALAELVAGRLAAELERARWCWRNFREQTRN